MIGAMAQFCIYFNPTLEKRFFSEGGKVPLLARQRVLNYINMRDTRDRLNTRDKLLLLQLIEQHGGLILDDKENETKLEKIHSVYVEHPVFKLSHNKLKGTEVEISSEKLREIVLQIYSKNTDLNIIQLCELYYKMRIEEIQSELSQVSKEFAEVRNS